MPAMGTPSSRLFRLHDTGHLTKYFQDIQDFIPLRLWHLPTLSKDDLLVTSHFSSPLFQLLFLFFPDRRPWLFRAADGLITQSGFSKKRIPRYGREVRENLFVDLCFVRQHREDLASCYQNGLPIISILKFETKETPTRLEGEKAVIVASNDPFYGRPEGEVVAAFQASIARLKAFGFREILLSCPNPRLSLPLLKTDPTLIAIGRMRDRKDLTPDTLCLGSPSTALFEAYLSGRPTLTMGYFQGSGLERHLTLAHALEDPSAKATRTVLLKTCAGSDQEKVRLRDTVKGLSRRVPPMDRRLFLSRLRVKLLISDLAFLLGLKS
jgi:hypothetical protein